MMKIWIPLVFFTFLVAPVGFAQDTGGEIDTLTAEMNGLVFSDDGEIVSVNSFRDLIGQAGGLRYPIYFVFLVGMFLIILKAIELFLDRRKAFVIESTSLRNMNLNKVSDLVAKQEDNMLARVTATLLNVFQTSKNTESLHDEVTNFVNFQQDRFNTFRSRIDFLSDTAGALGLLGTVWGMFIVFSSGNLEREIILTGMGIALLTTLIGLIVSIALNFSSTLVYSYFMKRLDQVKAKAEEMRFRLLEIQDSISREIVPPAAALNNNHGNHHDQGLSTAVDETEEVLTAEKVEPAYLYIESDLKKAVAGTELDRITIRVTDYHDKPVENTTLSIKVIEGGGRVSQTEAVTDANGHAWFNWELEAKPGRQTAEVKVKEADQEELKKCLEIETTAGEPAQLLFKANNQSGIPGKPLKHPLIALIRDENGNPVEGVNIHLEVTTGNGKLGKGSESVILTTDHNGQISTPFTLDPEAGFNAVDVSVKKAGLFKKYQAMGQELV